MRQLILLALLVSACASPSHPGDPGNVTTGVQVQTGRQFDISPGHEVQVQGTGLTIRFVGFSEDSRCPSDVQCVWAGNAIVRLSILPTGAPAADAALNTTLEPKSSVVAGYRVTLSGLKPQPRSGTRIPDADYVATLEVTPASG